MNNRDPTNGSAQKLKRLVFKNCLYLQHTLKDEPCYYVRVKRHVVLLETHFTLQGKLILFTAYAIAVETMPLGTGALNSSTPFH